MPDQRLDDLLDQLEQSIDVAIDRTSKDITDLKAQVATLQAKADAGAITDAELARLQALKDKIDQLDPTTPSVIDSG